MIYDFNEINIFIKFIFYYFIIWLIVSYFDYVQLNLLVYHVL